MFKKNINLLLVFGVAMVILLYNSMFIVPQSNLCLVLQFGKPINSITEPGLKFKIPFIQNVTFFDKRIQSVFFVPDSSSNEVMAADQKTMKLTAYAKYKIVDPLVFFRKIRVSKLFERHIVPIIESSIREAIGSFEFVDVLGEKRVQITDKILESVRTHSKIFGVEILDLKIIKVNLPDKAKKAVYERMKTDREKEAKEIRALGNEESQKIRAGAKRERDVMIANARRDSEKIIGEGESEAARILLEVAAQDLEFFNFYRTLNAYKNALNEKNTSIVLSTDSQFLNYLHQKNKK